MRTQRIVWAAQLILALGLTSAACSYDYDGIAVAYTGHWQSSDGTLHELNFSIIGSGEDYRVSGGRLSVGQTGFDLAGGGRNERVTLRDAAGSGTVNLICDSYMVSEGGKWCWCPGRKGRGKVRTELAVFWDACVE